MTCQVLIAAISVSAVATSASVTEKWKYAFQGGLGYDNVYPSLCTPTFSSDGSLLLTTLDGELISLSIQGKLKWNHSDIGSSVCAKVGADGKIYGGGGLGGGPTYHTQVAAIHKNGTLAWTYELGGSELESLSLENDGTVLFTADGQLRALSSDGALQWNASSDCEFAVVVPADDNATIYTTGSTTGSTTGGTAKVYSRTPSSQMKWKYDLGAWFRVSILERNEVVYALADRCSNLDCHNGTIIALDKQGRRKWSVDTDLPPQDFVFDSDENFYSATNTHTDNLYPPTSSVYAVSGSGDLKWKFHSNFTVTSPLLGGLDGTLYFGAKEIEIPSPIGPERPPAPCSFKALDKEGKIKWSIPTAGSVRNTAVGKDGTVYFDIGYDQWCLGSEKGSSTLLAASADGKVLWKFDPEADYITSPPVFGEDGVMYLTAYKAGPPGPTGFSEHTGIVYALDLPTWHSNGFVV